MTTYRASCRLRRLSHHIAIGAGTTTLNNKHNAEIECQQYIGFNKKRERKKARQKQHEIKSEHAKTQTTYRARRHPRQIGVGAGATRRAGAK
jgi:hypothetical protein